jgi:hypothetical protein
MSQAQGVPQFVNAQLDEAFENQRSGGIAAVGIAPGPEQGNNGRPAVQLGFSKYKGQNRDIQVHGSNAQDP